LDNRESEILVEKHLHELEERLRQKGYQVELKTETVERQSGAEHTVFDKIMQEDETVSNIKRYSFDIRA
jgi:3-dehydroquinate dehydratase